MTLGRPWLLLLLAIPAVLLWLRLRARRPREAEASSLLVWKKVSPSDTVSHRPRPPLSAWIEAAGAALLVLGAADPSGGAAALRQPIALVDTSPSMRTRTAAGTSRGDLATSALPLKGPPGFTSRKWAGPGPDLRAGIPAEEPVVVVTDHRDPGIVDDPPRLRVVGFGNRVFNAGITAASGIPLPYGRWRLLLEVQAFGSTGPVQGTLTLGAESSPLTLSPGVPVEVVRDVPAGTPSARIEFPADGLAEDDEVQWQARGGRQVVLREGTEWSSEPLVRALMAAGARVENGHQPEGASLEISGVVGGRKIRLRAPSAFRAGKEVPGASVAVCPHSLLLGVDIDPSLTLGTMEANRSVGSYSPWFGKAVMTAEAGPLLYIEESPEEFEVDLHFIPGGTWAERDPSFVVFAQNLVEFAAGGPARIEATGVLDARETREAAEGETFGDLKQALEEASLPDPAARASLALGVMAAGAALLAAAWFLQR